MGCCLDWSTEILFPIGKNAPYWIPDYLDESPVFLSPKDFLESYSYSPTSQQSKSNQQWRVLLKKNKHNNRWFEWKDPFIIYNHANKLILQFHFVHPYFLLIIFFNVWTTFSGKVCEAIMCIYLFLRFIFLILEKFQFIEWAFIDKFFCCCIINYQLDKISYCCSWSETSSLLFLSFIAFLS